MAKTTRPRSKRPPAAPRRRWHLMSESTPQRFLELGDTTEYEVEQSGTGATTHCYWIAPGEWALTEAAGSACGFVLDEGQVTRWRVAE